MTSDAAGRPLLPIACTLGPDDGPQRLEQWRRLSTVAGAGRTQAPGRVVLRFRDEPGVADQLRQLVDAERQCCAFLDWQLTHVAGECRVEITGSGEELAALPLEP